MSFLRDAGAVMEAKGRSVKVTGFTCRETTPPLPQEFHDFGGELLLLQDWLSVWHRFYETLALLERPRIV